MLQVFFFVFDRFCFYKAYFHTYHIQTHGLSKITQKNVYFEVFHIKQKNGKQNCKEAKKFWEMKEGIYKIRWEVHAPGH